MEKFHLPLPSICEQRKIALILSNVDSLIQQTQNEIEQTQKLKKGLMQKLLTKGIGHTKFQQEKWFHHKKIEIPDEWQIVNVGKVVTTHKQGLYTTQPYTDTGIKLVRVNNLQNPKLSYDKMVHLELDEKTINSFKIQKNDFLIARTGNIGNFGIMTQDIQCIFVSDIIRFTFNHDLLLNEFFGVLFQSELIKNQLLIIQQASSHIHINAETIKSLKIPLPTLSEQKKIIEIISKLDLQKMMFFNRKSKLENLKKGLMQKLLTGQIRVKV